MNVYCDDSAIILVSKGTVVYTIGNSNLDINLKTYYYHPHVKCQYRYRSVLASTIDTKVFTYSSTAETLSIYTKDKKKSNYYNYTFEV